MNHGKLIALLLATLAPGCGGTPGDVVDASTSDASSAMDASAIDPSLVRDLGIPAPGATSRPAIEDPSLPPESNPNGNAGDVLDLGTADTVFWGQDHSRNGTVLIPGDLDADGFDDMIIGDNGRWELGLEQRGQIHVIYGRTGFDPELDLARDTVTLVGHLPGEGAGNALAAAGDVDDDGYPDFLVSASGSVYGEGDDRGAAYLIYGGPRRLESGALRDVAVRIEGVTPGGQTGTTIAGLGDLDGDGRDDYAVGTSGNGPGTSRIHIFYGNRRPSGVVVSVADADVTLMSEYTFSYVWPIGDPDNDRDSDVLVMVWGPDGDERLVVLEGNKTRLSGLVDLMDLGGAIIQSRGFPAGSVGDLDGDGVTDFLAAADALELLFFHGRPLEGTITEADADARIISTVSASQRFGPTGGGLDLDGDACPDFYVADMEYAGQHGAVHIFSGGCQRVATSLDVAQSVTWVGRRYENPEPAGSSNDAAGGGVTIGDVNGDGVGDMLVSAPNDGVIQGGRVYLILGRRR